MRKRREPAELRLAVSRAAAHLAGMRVFLGESWSFREESRGTDFSHLGDDR
jgi:hypothetical protein